MTQPVPLPSEHRADLVAELNRQSQAWRDPLRSPPLRLGDGLAIDSPMGWQEVPRWRQPLIRLALFFGVAVVVGFAIAGLLLVTDSAGSFFWNATLQLVASVLAYWVLVRFLERRKPPIELSRRRWLGLPIGLAVGFGMCLLCTWLIWLLGGIEFRGVHAVSDWATQLWILGVVAGISEELIFRGVLHRIVESTLGTWAALLIVGGFFGFAHLGNPQATLVGALAIAVEAGVMFGAVYALTRSLWLVIGIHAAWNLTQGLVIGSVVSGATAGNGWIDSSPIGSQIVSGGHFGIEASIVSVLLWLSVAVWVLIRLYREGLVIKPFWVRHRTLPGHPFELTTRP